LARSFRLFRAFLREQSDPDLFYSMLAADSVDQLSNWVSLDGAMVLDVGGGPGYFARAFRCAGATYIGVELDTGSDLPAESFGLCGSAVALPVRSGCMAVTYSSNVLEHVHQPWRMADELVRVTEPGGTVMLSFTPWFSPWGGHETAPWHYFGGGYAARRYQRKHGKRPKNVYGDSLFGHRVGTALRWARSQPDAELIAAFPRYHPWWAWWLTRVPMLREVVLWNLTIVLRRR